MSESGSSREYFDRTAASFAANYASSSSFTERAQVWHRCITACLDALPPACVCVDVGCGDGALSRPLASRGHAVIGIDQSTSMLSLAVARAAADGVAGNCRYLHGTLPLSDAQLSPLAGSADLVLCSSVLEYVEEYAVALRQIDAMLRDGGRIIVSVPNRHSLYRFAERVLRAVLPSRDTYLKHQRHQFCAERFKAELEGLSYTIVHEEYFALPLQRLSQWLLGRYRGRRVATLYLVVAEKRGGTGLTPSTITA